MERIPNAMSQLVLLCALICCKKSMPLFALISCLIKKDPVTHTLYVLLALQLQYCTWPQCQRWSIIIMPARFNNTIFFAMNLSFVAFVIAKHGMEPCISNYSCGPEQISIQPLLQNNMPANCNAAATSLKLKFP